jgi:transposase
MRRTEVLQGLRVMRFEDVYGRWQQRRLSQAEAAEILGMSERSFRRWRDRYEDEGAAGLCDRRLGKASARRAPVDQVHDVLTLYRERYGGFTAKHFHDKLRQHHGFTLGYTWTKLRLQAAGLVAKAPRRGAHRKKRPRRPLRGMLLHQDGSSHRWLPALDRELDLIVTLDDATSEIYSAFLVEEEGTMSSFRALAEVIGAQGLPCALYTDRASHYFFTPKAGAKVAKDQPTQVGRALAQLGIEHIPAYAPEARGRSERAFGTLQDRLPKELQLAGITTIDAANRFLRETYLPEHNGRFAVTPEHPETAFVADLAGVHRDILCVQEERVVGNDNTVRYRGLSLQIPPSPLRPHFVKARVRVHDYPDGHLAIFHGPRCLARCRGDGRPLDHEQPLAA